MFPHSLILLLPYRDKQGLFFSISIFPFHHYPLFLRRFSFFLSTTNTYTNISHLSISMCTLLISSFVRSFSRTFLFVFIPNPSLSLYRQREKEKREEWGRCTNWETGGGGGSGAGAVGDEGGLRETAWMRRLVRSMRRNPSVQW